MSPSPDLVDFKLFNEKIDGRTIKVRFSKLERARFIKEDDPKICFDGQKRQTIVFKMGGVDWR